ncbi:MAG: M15 family metallopeptidase [Myxococcales bacterium]|nr:M15 family metallopeptidase [Myxococcales bacterium]
MVERPGDASSGGDAVADAKPDAGSSGEVGDEGATSGEAAEAAPVDYDLDAWREVQALDPSVVLDIRYATADNFVGEPLYPCGRCFLRPAVAEALVRAHRALQDAGYGGLKLFDCYRPTPIQARLWEITPDPRAVAPPTTGSMHNRGMAVDLTIVDREGAELDMGTAYDAFSARSYHTYKGLPAEVLANRRLLRETMDAAGFAALKTEWWHYSFRGPREPLADFVWTCTGPWPAGPLYWERRGP